LAHGLLSLACGARVQSLESWPIMGMFDEVRCEYPLPDAELQDERFQTKSFYRLLENYTITKDGKLVHDSSHWGKVTVPYTGDLSF
jgi:hypothetical protein